MSKLYAKCMNVLDKRNAMQRSFAFDELNDLPEHLLVNEVRLGAEDMG